MTAGPLKFSAGVKLSVPSGLTVTVPWAALTLAAVTVSGSPSTSLSLPSTAMLATGVLTGVLATSPAAAGASLTAVTVRLTVAVEVPPLPSLMVYVKLAGPLKLGVGVKTTEPPARLTLPPTGACTLVMNKALPSTSVSLPSKAAGAMFSGVSSAIGASVSVTASGASLTGVTLRVTVLGAASKAPAESCTLKVKLA